MITFSIIVPTAGRDTLVRTLVAVAPQLEDGDELLVLRNDNGDWGGGARNSAIKRAVGTHLVFIDDDDMHTEDALATMRAVVAEMPDRVHIFKMQYDNGQVLWQSPAPVMGNVGTPMVVVPNTPGRVATWTQRYECDFDFLIETLRLRGDHPEFHDHIVALIRPSEKE